MLQLPRKATAGHTLGTKHVFFYALRVMIIIITVTIFLLQLKFKDDTIVAYMKKVKKLKEISTTTAATRDSCIASTTIA